MKNEERKRKTDKRNVIYLSHIVAVFLSILYWELLLRETLGIFRQFTLYPLLFILAESLVISFLLLWFRNRTVNRIIICVLMFALCFFYTAQMVYFKVFGSIASMSMTGMGVDAVTNFWWALKEVLAANAFRILMFFIPVLLCIAVSAAGMNNAAKIGWKPHAAVLLAAVLAWTLGAVALRAGGTGNYTAFQAYHSRYTDTDTSSSKLGVLTTAILELSSPVTHSDAYEQPTMVDLKETEEQLQIKPEKQEVTAVKYEPNIIPELNFDRISESTESNTTKKMCSYFGNLTPTDKNRYTGLFEGKNLVYICAESFSTAAIDKELTPTLYKLANNGIVLNNFYNSFKNTTTNGEFALLTGLWPDVSRQDADRGSYTGSFHTSSTRYMPFALGNIFTSQTGAESLGYHGYVGEYYDRNTTHANIGFKMRFAFKDLKFTTSWPTSDYELIEQTVDDYINLKRWDAYYMTFSGHGTYMPTNEIAAINLDKVNEIVGDRGYNEEQLCYLACNYELEKALTCLVDRLEKAGELDNTVIVLVADHTPYHLTSENIFGLMGCEPENSLDEYRSTAIIYNSEIKEPITVDTPCCNVDILPTVLNLFGIEFDSRLLGGTDILAESNYHVALLYNKSYVTDRVVFDATTGKAIWTEKGQELSDAEKESYLEYMTNLCNNKYTSSLNILETDFYRYAFDRCGIKDKY